MRSVSGESDSALPDRLPELSAAVQPLSGQLMLHQLPLPQTVNLASAVAEDMVDVQI